MSGALKSIFGGGNIFGALLSLASMAFPPLAIAGSLSNLLTQAIGAAVKQAATMLAQEFGMPKFLLPVINQLVDGVVGNQVASNPTDAATDQFVADNSKSQLDAMQNDMARQIVDQTAARVRSSTSGKSGAKTTTASAGSWLEAIAIALGTAQGEKAAKMVQLADELSALSAKQTTGSTDEKTQNAQEFSIKSQQLQAVGQEYGLLASATTNVIKSIGEALSQAARKG